MSNSAIAVAAVIQAFATIILSCLTWRYVKLTKDVSDSARRQAEVAVEQLNLARDAYLERIRVEELHRAQRYEDRTALINRFTSMLNDIGGREFWDRPARQEPIWEERDIQQLIDLFHERPSLERRDAELLATHLRWLRGEVMKLRTTNEGLGYDPGQAWQNHADSALRLMNNLSQIFL